VDDPIQVRSQLEYSRTASALEMGQLDGRRQDFTQSLCSSLIKLGKIYSFVFGSMKRFLGISEF
jgi:hypothetical protein